MKKLFKYMPLVAAALLMTACQDNDEADFKSKAFIDGKTFTSETLPELSHEAQGLQGKSP